MLTIHELLEDKTYREFFLKQPKVPRHVGRLSPPWRVYVQLAPGGPWKRKQCENYTEAFKFLKKMLPRVHDATINCPRLTTPPPQRLVRIKGKFIIGSDGVKRQATRYAEWKPKIPPEEFRHTWCPYCRRPTIFLFYRKHHALKQILDPSVRRCMICGASERIINYPKAS